MIVAARILVIDNYDSFVFNLVQQMGEAGAEPRVVRNDATTVDELVAWRPDGVLISPGPGTPDDAGISDAVIERFAGVVPVLGVCLGHQCIAAHYGARVVRADELMHGKTSMVDHDSRGVFAGVENPLVATRYHSLVVDPDSIDEPLEVSATCDGVVMGLRHRFLDVEGVQFHPESVLTTAGSRLIGNFLARCERTSEGVSAPAS